MSVTAIYHVRANEGKADELLAILRQGRDFSRTVDACEGFEVFQRQEDPRDFVMTEQWTTVEGHRRASRRTSRPQACWRAQRHS